MLCSGLVSSCPVWCRLTRAPSAAKCRSARPHNARLASVPGLTPRDCDSRARTSHATLLFSAPQCLRSAASAPLPPALLSSPLQCFHTTHTVHVRVVRCEHSEGGSTDSGSSRVRARPEHSSLLSVGSRTGCTVLYFTVALCTCACLRSCRPNRKEFVLYSRAPASSRAARLDSGRQRQRHDRIVSQSSPSPSPSLSRSDQIRFSYRHVRSSSSFSVAVAAFAASAFATLFVWERAMLLRFLLVLVPRCMPSLLEFCVFFFGEWIGLDWNIVPTA